MSETVAMKICGYQKRSVFDRSDITSKEDLKEAVSRFSHCIQHKTGRLSGTVDWSMDARAWEGKSQVIESEEEKLELARGIEPPTGGLQNRCSTD